MMFLSCLCRSYERFFSLCDFLINLDTAAPLSKRRSSINRITLSALTIFFLSTSYCSLFDVPTLHCRLQCSQDLLILDVARLRLQEAIAVHERNDPSNPELPTMRLTLRELVERLNAPTLPLP